MSMICCIEQRHADSEKDWIHKLGNPANSIELLMMLMLKSERAIYDHEVMTPQQPHQGRIGIYNR
jgi:hypothetical protein